MLQPRERLRPHRDHAARLRVHALGGLLGHGRRRLPRLPRARARRDVLLRRLLHRPRALVPPRERSRDRAAGLDLRDARRGRPVLVRPRRRGRGLRRGLRRRASTGSSRSVSAARARACAATTSRSRGGALVTSASTSRRALAVTSRTARSKASALAWDGALIAAQLPHELQRRRLHLLVGRRRLEVEERPDVSAHGASPDAADYQESGLRDAAAIVVASGHARRAAQAVPGPRRAAGRRARRPTASTRCGSRPPP